MESAPQPLAQEAERGQAADRPVPARNGAQTTFLLLERVDKGWSPRKNYPTVCSPGWHTRPVNILNSLVSI